MSKKSNSKNTCQHQTPQPIIKKKTNNIFLRIEDISAIKYIVEHGGGDAITYINQINCEGEDCGKKCELCGGLLQSKKLPLSEKRVILTQDICDKLYDVYMTTEQKETELVFYLLGYYKDGDFCFEDIKVPYVHDKTECYVTIPVRRMKLYDFANNIKFRNKGEPVMFMGHTHPKFYTKHFEANKQSNNFSLVDLLSTSTTQMLVEDGFLDRISRREGNNIRFGTIMLNHLGDFSTSWENKQGKLEHFENLLFVDKQGELKDISEYEINGIKPFGVYREINNNYNITNRKNREPLIKNVLECKGKLCTDNCLEEDGKIYSV